MLLREAHHVARAARGVEHLLGIRLPAELDHDAVRPALDDLHPRGPAVQSPPAPRTSARIIRGPPARNSSTAPQAISRPRSMIAIDRGRLVACGAVDECAPADRG